MSEPFRIKVCGITTVEAAEAAVEAGADHLGLVLCPSARRVSPERAVDLVSRVSAAWIGVFVDALLEEMTGLASDLDLAAVQLHGREPPELCDAVRAATGLPVWKALVPGLREMAPDYHDVVDALLLDAGRGGGRTLDWAAVGEEFPRASRRVPVVLAGGLDAGNVGEAIRAADPDGVDASSRLESAPGEKDPDRVRAFVRCARAAGLRTPLGDPTWAPR